MKGGIETPVATGCKGCKYWAGHYTHSHCDYYSQTGKTRLSQGAHSDTSGRCCLYTPGSRRRTEPVRIAYGKAVKPNKKEDTP